MKKMLILGILILSTVSFAWGSNHNNNVKNHNNSFHTNRNSDSLKNK